jgi:hypothetical protein
MGVLSFNWGVFWAVLAAIAIPRLFHHPLDFRLGQIAHDIEKLRKHFVGLEAHEPPEWN